MELLAVAEPAKEEKVVEACCVVDVAVEVWIEALAEPGVRERVRACKTLFLPTPAGNVERIYRRRAKDDMAWSRGGGGVCVLIVLFG